VNLVVYLLSNAPIKSQDNNKIMNVTETGQVRPVEAVVNHRGGTGAAMKTGPRILLVDDNAILRAGVRSLLEAITGYEVVGEASDGVATLKLVQELCPDLVLLNISLPKLNGLDVLSRLAKLPDSPLAVVLSTRSAPECVARALNAGAVGYVLKESAIEELVLALAAAFAGQTYISQQLDEEVVQRFRNELQNSTSALDLLTLRQRQILQMVAEGMGTRAIAEGIHLSVKTVETHRAQLMQRLGIYNIAGLVHFSIRAGLISLYH